MTQITQDQLAQMLTDEALLLELQRRLGAQPAATVPAGKLKRRRKTKHYMSVEETNAALAMIRWGEMYSIIAERFGVSQSTIGRLAKDKGLHRRTGQMTLAV